MYELIDGDIFDVGEQVVGEYDIDLVLTDPPYNISGDIDLSHSGMNSQFTQDFGEWDHDSIVPEMWVPLLNGIDGATVISFYDNRTMGRLVSCLAEIQMDVVQMGYWLKPSPPPRMVKKDRWMDAVEQFVIASDDDDWFFNEEPPQQQNVLRYRSPRGDKRCHPNQKPVDLFAEIIRFWSEPDDVVFDPFMGSGTTGVACRKTGRDFVGVEVNKDYYELAQSRVTDDVKSVFDW